MSEYFKVSLGEVEKKATTKTDQWEKYPRKTEKDYRNYYLETDHECYRQLWYHRYEARYEILTVCKKKAKVLDYGCGVGATSSWLLEKRPDLQLTLTDVPSQVLAFAKWRLGDNVRFFEIGYSNEKLPNIGKFDVIICQEVLNHVINPLDVVRYFHDHLEEGGYLFTDFTSSPGGVHLYESDAQRPEVLRFLNGQFKSLRPLHEKSHETAIYRR